MDFSNSTIWQFAAGGKGRDYGDLLIDWDVIILGPGRHGPFSKNRDAYQGKHDVVKFYEEMEEGDLIVLRMGTSDVYALGIVAGPARYRDIFGDIDGWDLRHSRRVKWLWTHDGEQKSFESYTLDWGQTIHKGVDSEVEEWIDSLPLKGGTDRELRTLPGESGQPISMQDIGRYLFDSGVDSNAINDLIEEIDELNRIANWYARSEASPSEHETVSYLVIPLLRALGWTPQKMAVEWEKIDLALFSGLPREPERLIGAVEAKQWRNSCLSARSQAERYANEVAAESCERLVVTDGNRYGVFVRDGDDFPDRPDAYLNLADPKDGYPVMESEGAQEALRLMSADWGS
jgi:hypothetical protein